MVIFNSYVKLPEGIISGSRRSTSSGRHHTVARWRGRGHGRHRALSGWARIWSPTSSPHRQWGANGRHSVCTKTSNPELQKHWMVRGNPFCLVRKSDFSWIIKYFLCLQSLKGYLNPRLGFSLSVDQTNTVNVTWNRKRPGAVSNPLRLWLGCLMCLMKESWESSCSRYMEHRQDDRIYRDCSNHILMESGKHDLANHRSMYYII